MDSELLLVFGVFVSCAGWVIAVLVVVVARTPPRLPAGPNTLDLGPEPLAVANFLVHDFTVTADAPAATLIDLAARNVLDIEQRIPDVFYVRVRETSAESLEAYERRVLEPLARHARDGIGPAAALTTAHRTSRRAGSGTPGGSGRGRQGARALDGRCGRRPTAAVAASLVVAVGLGSSSTSMPRPFWREAYSARSRFPSRGSESCSRSPRSRLPLGTGEPRSRSRGRSFDCARSGARTTTSVTTSRSTTAPRTGSAPGASTKRSTGGSSRGI